MFEPVPEIQTEVDVFVVVMADEVVVVDTERLDVVDLTVEELLPPVVEVEDDEDRVLLDGRLTSGCLTQ